MTQVVSADEGHVFHNRLTHSIQVAQVGRRIAEKLVNEGLTNNKPLADIDPDVVEAACLAHDLGHPPFGHAGEAELNRIATKRHLADGFEGNAQSFRIVTRLAISTSGSGLNLTRATLNAILKYPWLRNENSKRVDKWGAYNSEEEFFRWARDLAESSRESNFVRSAEAYLMDLADDITYSVHDLDDFYRAGLIPLDRLRLDKKESERFYESVFERRSGQLPDGITEADLRNQFDRFLETVSLDKPFEGTHQDRQRVRHFTSGTINEFVHGVRVEQVIKGRTKLTMTKEHLAEIFMLKELTWRYVITAPSLTTQQHGQTAVIRGLFTIFNRAAQEGPKRNTDVFPISVRQELERASGRNEITRIIIDFIASLTEEQAVAAYHRLTGISLGSAIFYRWR